MAPQIKIIKIAVTGPLSSGKSFTSEYLAKVFDGWVVPEYAREYLNHLDRECTYQDILNIANGQLDVEKKVTADAIKEEVGIIFFDSELINTKIWCEEKYGKSDESIINGIIEADYDHYLLMHPDIDWEPDAMRENPIDRDRLFKIYVEHLSQYKKSYTIIEGGLDDRLKLAMGIIKTFMASKTHR